jgi:hypothetical protein
VNRYDPAGRQGIPADILPSNIYQGIPDISQGGRVRGTVTSIAGKLLRQMPGVQSFGELQQQAGSAALAARSGDKEAVKQIITGVVVGAVVAGIVKGVVDRRDNDKAQTDDPDKAKGKLSKKERREAERARSREAKHGDPDWEEPASESYVKNLGQKAERGSGKDARRAGHDAKEAGEGDRSKRQAREDYKVDEE